MLVLGEYTREYFQEPSLKYYSRAFHNTSRDSIRTHAIVAWSQFKVTRETASGIFCVLFTHFRNVRTSAIIISPRNTFRD